MNYAEEIWEMLSEATAEQLARIYWFIRAFLAAGRE